MSVENVQKFFELVKSNEELAQEIEKIKNKTQNKAGTVDYEQIISENVIPMAKERGLEFTLEDFLTYSSSIAPQGELSDDDLLNVSGGWSGNQMLATGLMLLTLGSSGLSMMGNIQSPGGGDGSSAGSAPTSSYSMSINNADEAAEETAEDTILQKVENSNIEKSSEDVSNEADEVIENNSEESDVADEDNGSTEDVSFNEEDAATTAQEDATEATEEETETETETEIETETNDEAIDFSSRLGYEDLDADNKELKDVSIDWTKEDNAALEDFFAEDDEENDGIEMTEEEINIDLNEGEDVYNYEAFDVENNEETTNEGEKNDDIKEFDNFNSETQILNFNDVDEDEQLNDDEVFDLFNDAENDEDENTENTDEATNEADAEKEEVNNEKTTNEEEENDDIKEFDNFNNEAQILNFNDVDEDEQLNDDEVFDLFNDAENDEDENTENTDEATNEADAEKDEYDFGGTSTSEDNESIKSEIESLIGGYKQEANDEADSFLDISQEPLDPNFGQSGSSTNIEDGYDDIWNFLNYEEATNEVNLDVKNDEKKEAQEEVNNGEATNGAAATFSDLFDDTFWNAGETNIENKEENTQNNEEVKTEVDLDIGSAEAQEEVSNKERKKDYKPISIAEAEGASDKMTVEQKINHVYKFLEGLEVTNENQNKIEAQFENSGDVKGDIADLLVSTPSDVGADAINKLDEMGSLSGEKQLSYENYDRNASWEAAANHVGKALEDAGGRQGIKPSTWAGFEKDLKEVNSRIRTDKKTGNLYLDESKAGGWFGESKNTNISQERLQTIKTAADNLAKLSKK